MNTLQKRLRLAKQMVAILGERTMQRTDWTVITISKTQCPPQVFDRMLKFLLSEGYVERTKRGIYRRTINGKRFAET